MQGVARLQGEGPSGPSPFSFPLSRRDPAGHGSAFPSADRGGQGAPGFPARPGEGTGLLFFRSAFSGVPASSAAAPGRPARWAFLGEPRSQPAGRSLRSLIFIRWFSFVA